MHAISRLSETWKLLDTTSKKQWNRINTFCSWEGNYKNYRYFMRKLFSSSQTPNVVPYFGLYLKDLTALEEGSSTQDSKGTGT